MGNMESCCQKRQQKWVHPCIRGEYNLLGQAPAGGKGSPPHPRGIFFLNHFLLTDNRFTPASAGNIFLYFLHSLYSWVHPRIRGEYTNKMLFLCLFSIVYIQNIFSSSLILYNIWQSASALCPSQFSIPQALATVSSL